jgi:hypothetical protein
MARHLAAQHAAVFGAVDVGGGGGLPEVCGGQQRAHDSLPTPAFSALDQDGGNLPNWLVDANNPLKYLGFPFTRERSKA